MAGAGRLEKDEAGEKPGELARELGVEGVEGVFSKSAILQASEQ